MRTYLNFQVPSRSLTSHNIHMIESATVSNYELYADLSSRMMNVIGRFSDNHYVYSIDESFLKLDGFNKVVDDWYQYGKAIRLAVWRETKLPVGVGFGITPTLSKAANHAAKKLEGFNGVAVITCNQEAKDILSRMKVTDVWGVGSRLGRRLNMMRIYTAYDLAKQSPKNMRSQFSVVLERTIEELNGNVCLSWDEVKQDKQEIFSTRSFGERVTNIRDLNAALITHSSIVGKKLREQASLTNSLLIFAHSSQHEGNFYKRSFLYDFATPTNDSRVLANAVSEVLPQIYSDDVRFYKAGVGAIDLTSEYFFQSDLFTPNIDNQKLMSSMDNINKIFGKGTIRLASEQQNTRWSMKRNFLSPRYTTRWRDIPIIKC